MTLPVVIRPSARAAVLEACAWYEAQQPGLGPEFEAAFRECAARIQEHPQAFPLATKRVRRARMSPFPYLLFYHVARHVIVVHSVFHTSRDPKLWLKRPPRDE